MSAEQVPTGWSSIVEDVFRVRRQPILALHVLFPGDGCVVTFRLLVQVLYSVVGTNLKLSNSAENIMIGRLHRQNINSTEYTGQFIEFDRFYRTIVQSFLHIRYFSFHTKQR